MMPRTADMDWRGNLAVLFTAVLCAGLNVVIDIPVGGSVLRLGASDLVLAPAFAALAVAWWGAGRPMPGRQMAWVAPVLLAFTLWLTVSLFVGRAHMGRFSAWALFNKYAGWYALLAYLAVGTVAGQLFWSRRGMLFLRATLLAAVMGCVVSMVVYELAGCHLVSMVPQAKATPVQKLFGLIYGESRMSGLMNNPNAFGFILASLTLLVLPTMKRGAVFSRRLDIAALALLLACLAYSGSRASVGGFVLGLLLLVVLRQVSYRQLLLAGLGALAVLFVLHLFPFLFVWTAEFLGIDLYWHHLDRLDQRDVLLPNSGNEHSLLERFDAYMRGLRQWAETPWLGIGLGTFLAGEIASGKPEPQVIHSTWVWLLVETGPTGLVLMGGFFAAVFLFLARAVRRHDCPLSAGMAALAVAFAAMGSVHEVLYQRHIWLFLGMALALPPLRRASSVQVP